MPSFITLKCAVNRQGVIYVILQITILLGQFLFRVVHCGGGMVATTYKEMFPRFIAYEEFVLLNFEQLLDIL